MTAVASLLLGVPLATTASASIIAVQTPAEACAQQATGTVGDAVKLAVCFDLVKDLTDIGQRLGTPIIRPTTSLTSPVQVIFAAAPSGDTLLRTAPFVPGTSVAQGLIAWEPCQITVFPGAYDEQTRGVYVSALLHVLIAHEVVRCYQYVVAIAFKANLNTDPFPEWISEGSATYLAVTTPSRSHPWRQWLTMSPTSRSSPMRSSR